jgi:hypothetical protein
MNRGLFGPLTETSIAQVMAWRSKQVPLVNGLYHEENQPFILPAMVQSVLVCTVPTLGYQIGDLWHLAGQGANSTVNSIDYAIALCDGQKVATQGGAGGAGSSRTALAINGTGGYIPLASFNEMLVVLGPGRSDLLGLPNYAPVRRYRTPPRSMSPAGGLYSFKNLLGRAPAFINPILQCRIPDLGYKAGDCIETYSHQIASSGGGFRFGLRANDKVIDAFTTNSASGYFYRHAVTGVQTDITLASWVFYLEIIG